MFNQLHADFFEPFIIYVISLKLLLQCVNGEPAEIFEIRLDAFVVLLDSLCCQVMVRDVN